MNDEIYSTGVFTGSIVMTPLFRFSLFQIALLFFVIAVAHAQDGKIIEQTQYKHSGNPYAALEKNLPDLKPVLDSVNFYKIKYMSDGLKVNGYLLIPKKPGKYPCVIYNRGGNRDFGALDDDYVIERLGRIANWGYVVIASQYRGLTPQDDGKDEFGGADLNDVLNCIPALASVPQADTSRIGLYGRSRGGMMTYLTLTRTSRIKAAVVVAGMADVESSAKERPRMDSLFMEMMPGYTTNRAEVARSRSAVHLVEKMNKTTPLLIIQGSSDWRVGSGSVIGLVDKLHAAKHPVRFILYEGADHHITEYQPEMYAQIKRWLDMYVRDKAPLPVMEPPGE